MDSYQSTASVEPAHIDLIRRYCPGLAVYTHTQVAAHGHPDVQGCWPWDGYITPGGYGRVYTEGSWSERSQFQAHRYMYDILVGSVLPTHDVHHRCEHKACWNPFHLEEVTPKEHSARHRQPLPCLSYPCDARGQFLLFAS